MPDPDPMQVFMARGRAAQEAVDALGAGLTPAEPTTHEPEPTVPARERFAVGDRVRATAAAHSSLFRHGSPRTGEVVGFGADDFCVRVRLDGRKSAATYSADFWEKEPSPGPPTPGPDPMSERIARLRRYVDARLATARAMGLEAPHLPAAADLDVLAALFAELDAARAELARHKPLTMLDPDTETVQTVSGTDPRFLEWLRQQREQRPPPGPPQP